MSEDSEALTYCFNLSYFRTSDFHVDAYVEISLPRTCLAAGNLLHNIAIYKSTPDRIETPSKLNNF